MLKKIKKDWLIILVLFVFCSGIGFCFEEELKRNKINKEQEIIRIEIQKLIEIGRKKYFKEAKDF